MKYVWLEGKVLRYLLYFNSYPGSTGFSHDIAVLKLVSPLQYSATVGPVAIAPANHLATGNFYLYFTSLQKNF